MNIKQLKAKLDNLKIWKESEIIIAVLLISMSCYVCAVSCRNFLMHESFFSVRWILEICCSTFSLYAVDCRQALFSRTLNIPFTYLPIYYWKLRNSTNACFCPFLFPCIKNACTWSESAQKWANAKSSKRWMPNGMSNDKYGCDIVHKYLHGTSSEKQFSCSLAERFQNRLKSCYE